MNSIVRPGRGVLFMKVGTHAKETLPEIIERKLREVDEAGFAMWGYGGNTCHPLTMVQPFAQEFGGDGKPIYLCMEEMNSRHFAEPLSAAEYSADGKTWEPVPGAIDVRGSRYALLIDDLREEHFDLPLSQTRVPIGPSQGRIGARYVRGQVDKACLEVLDNPELPNEEDGTVRKIGLVARLRPPYAVLLRKYREPA